MWIFLLSDTFIFSCFLISYMTVRMSTTGAVAESQRGLRADISAAQDVPLILIAIMTFVLISSSGTMAMAVNFGYRRDRATTAVLMLATAASRRHLRRHAGLRMDQADRARACGPGAIRWARAQFGSTLLHDHGLSRPARIGRRDLPAHRGAEGLAR